MTVRQRVFSVLDSAVEGDRLSRALDLTIVVLILANVAAAVLETVPSIGERHAAAFARFEQVSLVLFGIEYLLRVWSCTTSPRYAHPFWGRVRYALRPLMVVDLLAILPGLLMFTQIDLRMLRSLRLLRILRLFKLTKHSVALQAFGATLRTKSPELLSTLFVMLLLLIMSSSLMFALERDANPAFDSIPTAMWWGIATFTTVGYGDITPITPMGRVLGGIVGILGIAMFAIPAGLLGAAFTQEMAQRRPGRPKGQTPDDCAP